MTADEPVLAGWRSPEFSPFIARPNPLLCGPSCSNLVTR
jgi:hypothetical protein